MNNRAEFVEVSNEQEEKIENAREAFSKLYDFIDMRCLSSRETSIAITKLEEAQFWVIKGISREKRI